LFVTGLRPDPLKELRALHQTPQLHLTVLLQRERRDSKEEREGKGEGKCYAPPMENS